MLECSICHKATEGLVENCSSRIEQIRKDVKKENLSFRIIEDYLCELQRIIGEIEKRRNPTCNKATEIISEKRLSEKLLLRKFKCGHANIIKATEKTGPLLISIPEDNTFPYQSTVDSAKELFGELRKLRDAKLPQRKAMTRAFRILKEDWQILTDSDRRSVDFLWGQFQRSGDLNAEHLENLERLKNKYLNKRRGVSPDIIAMRNRSSISKPSERTDAVSPVSHRRFGKHHKRLEECRGLDPKRLPD